jgi:ribosomal protein L40E
MRCSSCGSENSTDAAFCEQCGARLQTTICPSCSAPAGPAAKFCRSCGASLSDDSPPKASERVSSTGVTADDRGHEVLEGERKTVTALFPDIKGSTELMRDLDPEEARAIVDPALKLMIDATHRYDDLRRAIGVGRADDGQAQAAKVMRINPGFTLEYQKQHSVVIKGPILDRNYAYMARAGLK